MVPTGLGAFLSNVLFSVEPRPPSTQIWLLLAIYRGADPPLETVKLWSANRLRCGRAPLLRAAPGTIFTRHRLSPATSFVPEVPPRNAYLHPVLQRHFAASVPRGRFTL